MIRIFRLLVAATATSTSFVLALAGPAWAAPPPANQDPTVRIYTILANITSWVTGVAFAYASLFLAISAVRRASAGGDPTKVERASQAFNNALFGYALALLAPIALGVVRSWIGG